MPIAPLPLVDLAAAHDELGEELEAAVLAVIRSGQFIGGPEVAAFEHEFADYLGSRHAVAMANGTDALELAFRALELPPGATVLVPANTFIATAAAVVAAGGVPRFVDVDQDSGLIDLAAAEAALDDTVWGIAPVHLYGRMVDMQPVLALAERHGLQVVEDAAQAHGARLRGRAAGTQGAIGCFSFYPGKNLGAFGDAGVAVTDDDRLAAVMRQLREHGRTDHRSHVRVGRNSRMDPIHATVLRIKLRRLEDWNARRRAAAALLREQLPGEVLDGFADGGHADVHHLFPILVTARDRLIAELAATGIQTGIHYAEPLHRTEAFASLGGHAPVAEQRARTQLSLPMHPHLREADVERIALAVTDAASTRAA